MPRSRQRRRRTQGIFSSNFPTFSAYTASTSRKRAFVIGPRATSTTSAETSRLGFLKRKASRNSRFARLRATAPPTRRLATTPKRSGPLPRGTTKATKKRQTKRCPSWYALRMSFPWRSRSRGKMRCPRRVLVTRRVGGVLCADGVPALPVRLSTAYGYEIRASSYAGADSVDMFFSSFTTSVS